MPHADGRRLAGTAVLEEEREVRDEGAEDCEQDAEIEAHEKEVSAPDRVLM
jgi:hypothetical protein